MANITWNGTTGFWNIGGNWIGGIVPTSADVAFINGGTATNNAAASISSVAINNGATLASSANLTVTSSIGVGASGSGRADLNVSGGTVSAGTSVVIGAVAGNNGLVSVFNTGVLQANTIAVGSASTGTLSIFNGGTVTATAGLTVGSGANLGTINIGESSLAGTINGNIAFGNAGSRIIFNSSNTASYAGNISGAGSVTVNSPAQTAILTGTNTHSGMTTITAGTLQIGNGGTTGTLGSGAVSIAAPGALDFNRSGNPYFIDNAISGAGNVGFRGGALVVLNGVNSYTGTTTVAAGTNVQVNSNIGTGDILVSGLVDFNNGGATTYAGIISGTGSIRSAGALTLTGANTYAGATNIAAGTLQIGNNGTTGSLGTGTVTIQSGATLAFQHSDGQYVNANVISGSGNVVHRGSGGSAEVLSGNNSYIGTTTIDGGVLAVGFGGTTGTLGTGNVILMNDGNLDLIRSDTQVIANAITGAGNVRVYANHTAILTGANTYSGTSVIFDGANTLQIGNGGTGGSLGTSAVTIGAGATLAFQHGAGTYTNTNVISGAGNVVQRGARSLEILTGNNSYTGTTTINDSGLAVGQFGTSGTLGTGDVILMNGGALDLTRSDTQLIANTITGDGEVRVYANHTAILTGANTYSGTSAIFDGANTLQIGNGGTGGSLGTSAVTIGAGATLAFQHGAGTFTNANVVSGAGAVVQRGTGSTEVLTGNNSHTGTTTINSGNTLQIGNGGGSGTLGSGSVTNNGTLAFNRSTDIVAGNVISGSGALVKNGGGDLYVTAANTYSGTTTINAGRINIGSIGGNGTTGSIGTGAVIIAGANAELNYFRSNDATIANAISGIGSFTKTGVGVLTLTGTNTYSGVTQISGGTLRAGDINALSSNSIVNVAAGARLHTGIFNQTIGGLMGGGIVESGGDNILTLNNSSANTFSGVIQNGARPLRLTKTGAGTQTLSGINTYVGDTQINAGAIALTGTGSIESSRIVNIAAGARFDISGISGASTSVLDVNIDPGSQIILGGKTLNVTAADSTAGAGAFVGSAGTEAVIFTVATLTFTLVGQFGAVFTNWTDGVDSITINGNSSANTLTGDELRATIINGGDGADIIAGGAGDDVLSGGAGNDTIDGAGGTNTLAGGADNDTYIVTQGNVTINEVLGEGIDLVRTNKSSFFLSANVENLTYTGVTAFFGVGNILDNVIVGGVGVDQLEGRDGNDTLNDGVGSAADALFGGIGNDIYIVNNRGSSTLELVGQGIDEVRTTFFIYALQSNIENLTYTDNAQHGAGVGNILDNVLTGGTGVDDLFGRAGNDTLRGGSGAANTVLGQEGDDIYVVEAVGDSVIEFVNEGTDTVQTALAIFTLRDNVENLTYTGAATFTGIGATGANTITGGALDDFLSGLDGADILVGKSGADFLLGGAGADQYRYEGGETGFDRITDFVSGVDKIALRDAGFTQTSTFALAQGGTPVATTTNSTFLYNINTGILTFDADGTGAGAAVTLAQLNPGLTLTLGDFLFY